MNNEYDCQKNLEKMKDGHTYLYEDIKENCDIEQKKLEIAYKIGKRKRLDMESYMKGELVKAGITGNKNKMDEIKKDCEEFNFNYDELHPFSHKY